MSAACDAQAEGQTGMGQRKIWVPARFLGVSGSQAEEETRKGSSSTTKQGLARDLFLLDFWDVTGPYLVLKLQDSEYGAVVTLRDRRWR